MLVGMFHVILLVVVHGLIINMEVGQIGALAIAVVEL